jgi:8-amino-3,8-dideoxy-alpha-D-manno-octulosonate transaminase
MTNDSVQRGVNRRAFLAAVPAFAAAAPMASGAAATLAVSGGKPVRTSLLKTEYPGAQFYDDQERTELNQAYDTHSLFRFYGSQPPKKCAAFEQEMQAKMGVKFALGVTSGTAALHCALTALGVGPGDEVILPAWTWHSDYTTTLLTGALPVFAEADESFCIDPADVEAKITPRTKAIIVVHLFGSPADMGRILAIGKKHNVKILEDVAQAAGGSYNGKRLGSLGDIAIYSFQLHKVISAGEGGAVLTNDPVLYERAIRFHDLGLIRPVHSQALGITSMPYFVGVNYRMNEMTGGVMRAQLRKLDTIIGNQRKNWQFVKDQVQGMKGWKLRHDNDAKGDIGWTVNFMLPSQKLRDDFVKAMTAENVAMTPPSSSTPLPPAKYIEDKCVPHPAWPTFNTPRGKAIKYGAASCPKTMDIFNRTATLTIGPKFTQNDMNDVVAALKKVHAALLT